MLSAAAKAEAEGYSCAELVAAFPDIELTNAGRPLECCAMVADAGGHVTR